MKAKNNNWEADDFIFLLHDLLIAASAAFFIVSFAMCLNGFILIGISFLLASFIFIILGKHTYSHYRRTRREILSDMEDDKYADFLKTVYLAGKNDTGFIWNEDWCKSREDRPR